MNCKKQYNEFSFYSDEDDYYENDITSDNEANESNSTKKRRASWTQFILGSLLIVGGMAGALSLGRSKAYAVDCVDSAAVLALDQDARTKSAGEKKAARQGPQDALPATTTISQADGPFGDPLEVLDKPFMESKTTSRAFYVGGTERIAEHEGSAEGRVVGPRSEDAFGPLFKPALEELKQRPRVTRKRGFFQRALNWIKKRRGVLGVFGFLVQTFRHHRAVAEVRQLQQELFRKGYEVQAAQEQARANSLEARDHTHLDRLELKRMVRELNHKVDTISQSVDWLNRN